MKTINSLSGGKTSSYMAVNYPADFDLFCLVRTNDKRCQFPDPKIRQIVSDKIGTEFIGTLEQDEIIYTMLDLEQFIGRPITWLTGVTFEQMIDDPKNNVLPSPLRRYCTALLKNKPIFDFVRTEIQEIVEMRIGFRANEMNRANSMKNKLDDDGVLWDQYIIGKHKDGRNKWEKIPYSKPSFPLISDGIFKDNIEEFWKNKPVRFAWMNNCVGCFHKNPILLRKMWDIEPEKMQFFSDLEQQKIKGRKFKNDTFKMTESLTYERIKNWNPQFELFEDDFNECDSGYCGI